MWKRNSACPAVFAMTGVLALLVSSGCQENGVNPARNPSAIPPYGETDYYTPGNLPPSEEITAETPVAGVAEAIADATEEALRRWRVGRLVTYFVDSDADRLSDWTKAEEDTSALDAVTKSILLTWERRYDQPLRMDRRVAFGPNYRKLRIDFLSPDVAIATFAAEGNLPEVKVRLLEIDRRWRIDVPDRISDRKLYANLLRQLTQFAKASNTWPDVNGAQYLLAQHVMAAIYGVGGP